MFHLHGDRRKSSVILARLVRKLGGHWQHQVIQKAADHIVVHVAADASWTPRHGEDLRQIVQTYFEAQVRVEVEVHDRLPMPASGKFQNMVNELERSTGHGA